MSKRFTFTAQEQTLIGACIALAQKAGSAAQTACMLAYLTQGEREAHLLVGYSDEAETVMKKPNDDGTFALSRGAIEAVRVGVNVYGEKLQRSEKTDTALLLGTEDHQTRRDEAQRLSIKLSHDLFTETEPVVEGAGKPPKKDKAAKASAKAAKPSTATGVVPYRDDAPVVMSMQGKTATRAIARVTPSNGDGDSDEAWGNDERTTQIGGGDADE